MLKTYEAPGTADTEGKPKPGIRILINEDWCKGCGICIEFCPKSVLAPTGVEGKVTAVDPAACTKCMLCELRCPDFAIRVRSNDEYEDDEVHAG